MLTLQSYGDVNYLVLVHEPSLGTIKVSYDLSSQIDLLVHKSGINRTATITFQKAIHKV